MSQYTSRGAHRVEHRAWRLGMSVWLLVGGLALVGTAPAAGADPPSTDPPTADQLRSWVRDLDADNYSVRDRATKRLQQAGDLAYEYLLDALRSSSPEVRRRAEFILRDAHWRRLYSDFAEFAARPDDRLDVEYGMWLISRLLDPQIRRSDLQKQLDGLAERVRRRFPAGTPLPKLDPQVVMRTLREVLFDELKFHGADADYRNPRNSSLACVLERKRGLPIVLSHLVIAIGRRQGWPLEGVATPGRYLLKYDGQRAPDGFPREDLVMDAYAGGVLLSRHELELLFPGVDLDELTEPAEPRAILVRMLNNLESHLAESGDQPLAEFTLTCRLLLDRDREF